MTSTITSKDDSDILFSASLELKVRERLLFTKNAFTDADFTLEIPAITITIIIIT